MRKRILALAATLAQEEEGTAEVLGAVAISYAIEVPGYISLVVWADNILYKSTARELSAFTNDTSAYVVDITVEDQSENEAYLYSDFLERYLTNPLKVKGGDMWDYAPLYDEEYGEPVTVLLTDWGELESGIY